MGVNAAVVLLADISSSLQAFVRVFTLVYTLLILAHVLLSWIPSGLRPVRGFLHDVCDPTLRVFRRVIPSFGPLDLSPVAAMITIQVAGSLVIALIGRIL
ncbi:MAG: YggT family protein [Thermoleophilia bacterium]|nr:YggT family protein [Thermoleophilia bacterium]